MTSPQSLRDKKKNSEAEIMRKPVPEIFLTQGAKTIREAIKGQNHENQQYQHQLTKIKQAQKQHQQKSERNSKSSWE